MGKALFIGRFKQAWPKNSVNFKGGADYFVGEGVMLHGN